MEFYMQVPTILLNEQQSKSASNNVSKLAVENWQEGPWKASFKTAYTDINDVLDTLWKKSPNSGLDKKLSLGL